MRAFRCLPVAIGWGAMCSLALSATFEAKPAMLPGEKEPSEQAKAAADVVSEVLALTGRKGPVFDWNGRRKQLPTFEANAQSMLNGAAIGFGLWEIVTFPVPERGRTYVQLQHRHQSSVQEWHDDPVTGDLTEVVQSPPVNRWGAGGYGGRALPYENLLHLAYPSPDSGYEGLGLLRPVLPDVADYNRLKALRMVAADRLAVPTPHFEVDRDAYMKANSGKTEKDFEEECTRWLGVGRKLTAHEESGLVTPTWVTAKVYGQGAHDPTPMNAMIREVCLDILMVTYSQFLQLGQAGAGGAYSLVKSHTGFADRMAQGLNQWLCNGLNGLIELVVRLNLGSDFPRDLMPTIVATGLDSPAFMSALNELVAFFAAGMPQQASDWADIRSAFGLKAPDGTGRSSPRASGPVMGRPVAVPA